MTAVQPVTYISRIVVGTVAAALGAAAAITPPAEPLSMWFTGPGKSFHEACVLGNGRLGAMDLGGVDHERIVLNESSLWSGGAYDGNSYDAYQCLPQVREKLFANDIAGAWGALTGSFHYAPGVAGWGDPNQFGCYQTLGDLSVVVSRGSGPQLSSPSGHDGGTSHENLAMSTDGQPATKWFVQHADQPVIWQMAWPTAQTVKAYTLTSGNDMPDRDPRAWVLAGSTDGKSWSELDRRALDQPFEQRHQTKTFEIAHPVALRFYRITFAPPPAKALQLAEITLAGTTQPPIVPVADYRRDLNLLTGVATTCFTQAGVTITRELVVSKPDEVIALRITADRPGALSLTTALSRKQNVTYRVDGMLQVMEGQLPFNKPGGGGVGMRYQALLGYQAKGGKITAGDRGLTIENADEVTFIVAAGTDWNNPEFPAQIRQRLTAALAKPFNAIRDGAAAQHRQLMERVKLELPQGPKSNLSTPERIRNQEGAPDPSLAMLYFQFGRHLLVSGSQADSQLPTNLQGIWAEEYETPWRGDFHSNINLQMNYWPAEVTNLSECHLPLLRFIKNVAGEGRKTAKAYFNAPGWMANHTQNPWYETAPSHLPACVGPTCGAWLTQHVWWHYAFTEDKKFLAEYYPVLRGASEFMQAVLVEHPKTHELVVVPSNSPENAYVYTDKDGKKRSTALCVGSTFDQQITRELFRNTAAAARILGIDQKFAQQLDATRAKLAPTRLNPAGRIMEWQEDFEETEVNHRHVSHLWGLHPGSEINPSTPDLTKGARLTLERRGDASTGWSMGWKANFWARLHDGDRAERLLAMLIQRGAPNFFCLHPPFQIDGNFGGCAAVAEMLVQSQESTAGGAPVIELLPALPKAWHTGKVTGLRARGNYQVDIQWQAGKITSYRIASAGRRDVQVRIGGQIQTVKTSSLP